MKLITIIFSFLLLHDCYCQNDSVCDYTINKNEGNGLSLRISAPCSWQKFEGRPGVVKAFKDSNGTSLVVMIAKTEENKNGYIITEESIKANYEPYAKVISTRKTKLEGLTSIEAIIEYSQERPIGVFYSKSLIYSTVYKNYLFSLGYACAGLNQEEVRNRFEEYVYTFKVLASRTVLLNKTTF